MMLGKIDSNKGRGLQRMRELDSITDSIDMDLNKIWEIARGEEPGVLQSVGSQRIGLNLAAEQQQQQTYWRGFVKKS